MSSPMTILAQSTSSATAEDAIMKLVETDMVIPLVAIVLGCLVAIIAIIFTTVKGMVVGKSREQTKRELAAYVAEGTISPDQAVSIINAGKSSDSACG